MFRLYDYQATGRIPKHLAVKLVKGLGFDFGSSGLGKEVSLKELLLWLDQRCAERFPILNWSLETFSKMVSSFSEETGTIITPEQIIKFYESLGRAPIPQGQLEILLTSMLEYDDCSSTPIVKPEAFKNAIILYAKKNNVMKEFR